MKHITHVSLAITVVVILVLASSFVAFAGTFRSPSKDIYCQVGGTCVNGFGITTNASNTAGPCNSTQVGYIGWNLSGVTTALTSAKLTLTTTNVTGAPAGPLTFSLLVPGNHTWTEPVPGPTGGTDPGVGAVPIATGTATLINGATSQTVTFGGSGDPVAANALGAYFEGLRSGANPANSTIAVRISGGCTTSSVVTFAERGTAGEADLILQGGATAVTLSTFHASDPAVNWPLIAGSGVLAAVVIGGLAVTRRRAAGR